MRKGNASIALVVFTVIALCIASAAVAAKGGKPGSGGVKPMCFLFLDDPFDRIGSDLPGAPPGDRQYCNDKKEGISAQLTQDGHLVLNLQKNTRGAVRRSFFVDWTLGPGNLPLNFGGEYPGGITNIYTTADLDAVGTHTASLHVAPFLDAVDLRTMEINDTVEVNLRVNLYFTPDEEGVYERFGLHMRFEPPGTINFRSCPELDGYGTPPPWPIEMIEVTCLDRNADDTQCNRWLVTVAPGKLACVGRSYENDNEPYELPFTVEGWVMD